MVFNAVGGGMVGTMLVVWFYERFHVGAASIGPMLTVSYVLTALSFIGAAAIARRFGSVHLIVISRFAVAAVVVLMALAPTFLIAASLNVLRQVLSQMITPVRQSFTMGLFPTEERASVSGVTGVVRRVGAAASPALTGIFLSEGALEVPFFISSALQRMIGDIRCTPCLASRAKSCEDGVTSRGVETAMTWLYEGELAEKTRVFPLQPDGRVAPDDQRLREVRRLDQAQEPSVFDSLETWQARAEVLRRRILVSAGLWPQPQRIPIAARVFGRIERGDYTVEKVMFESFPGFLVTGNLYRPLGRPGPFPGILTPHGHWQRGRLQHDERTSAPARCISFARQGYVAFSYDMVGYVDSAQIPHRFGGPIEALWGMSPLGLQLWNSLRSVDFLLSLPDVDPDRLGCTGESGGGTQAILLTAIDDRIKVSSPVNMVSAHMQGGCACENAPGLRLDATNVELAALTAPRPMLLVSCTGDWTRNTPNVEYPAIRAIYRLFDAEDRLSWVQIDAGHNYNRPSREAVYAFFGRWLGDVAPSEARERPLTVEPDENLRVFPDGALPTGTLDAAGLRQQWIHHCDELLAEGWPRDAAGLARFRASYLPAWQEMLGVEWPTAVSAEDAGLVSFGGLEVERLRLSRPGQGDQIPALLIRPTNWEGRRLAVVIHAEGKAMLLAGLETDPPVVPPTRGDGGVRISGRDRTEAHGSCRATGDAGEATVLGDLLGQGYAVLAVDVFLTGEYHTPWGQSGRDQSARFFTTYNRSDLAWRVQDILTALAFARERVGHSEVPLVGLGDAGLWCLLARPISPDPPPVIADACQFAASDDSSYVSQLFTPSLRRLGDLRTALALAAPSPVLIHNAARAFQMPEVEALYVGLSRRAAFRIRSERIAGAPVEELIS